MWRRFTTALGACALLGLAGTALAAMAPPDFLPALPALDVSKLAPNGVNLPTLTRLRAPDVDLVYAIAAAVFALSLLALWLVRSLLARSPGWSLGDALSEEVDLTNDQGAPIKVLRASASRLIAFSGLLIMLFLYFGFGMFLLYYFGTGQKVPQDVLDGIQKFMLAGLALFAPYAANQVRAALSGGSKAPAPTAPPKAPPPVGHGPAAPQLEAPAQPETAAEAFLGGC